MSWGIVYYRDETGHVPVDAFLDACPTGVEAKLLAVLEAVRESPPPRFSGGGMREAMHGSMKDFYEVRGTGPPARSHYRLFCILENASPASLAAMGYDEPKIAVITGMVKPNARLFTDAEYDVVRKLGDDHRKQFPRRIAVV